MIESDYILYETKALADAPCAYFVNMHEHPFDLTKFVTCLRINVVSFFVSDWDDDLSPWKAPGLYKGDADFKGNADATLGVLLKFMDRVETSEGLSPSAHAIAGYSMGGLFSTYAFLNSKRFKAMASMSGSLWFEGWPHYLHEKCEEAKTTGAFKWRFAFFSIGSKEKKSPPRILSCVEDRNRNTAEALKAAGAETEFRLGSGNHFEHMEDRVELGLNALQEFFNL